MNLLTIVEAYDKRLFEVHTHLGRLSLFVATVATNPIFVKTINLTFVDFEVTFVKALKLACAPFAFVGANLNTVSKTLVRIVGSNSALTAGVLKVCNAALCLAHILAVGILVDVLFVSVDGVDRYGRVPESLFCGSLLILALVLSVIKFECVVAVFACALEFRFYRSHVGFEGAVSLGFKILGGKLGVGRKFSRTVLNVVFSIAQVRICLTSVVLVNKLGIVYLLHLIGTC